MAFVFKGIKIECTNGMFLKTEFDREAGRLMIKEFKFIQSSAASAGRLSGGFLDETNGNVHSLHCIKLPVEITSKRVIGKPLCIGCKDNILLYQYTTDESRYVCFFITDLASEKIYLCEDTEHYFSRDLLTAGTLEGIVCPDKRTALIRLPQNVLSSHKWSKIMQLDIKQNSLTRENSDEMDDYRNCRIISSCLQDKKHLAIAVNPRKPSLVYTALVDEFCFKCKFLVRNISSRKIEMDMRHRVAQPSVAMNGNRFEDTSSGDDDLYSCTLLQTSMVFSRDGEVVILVYLASAGERQDYCIACMYDAQTLQPIGNHIVKVVISPPFKPGCNALSTIISPNDEFCSACLFENGTDQFKTLCSFKISRQPNLKRRCREVILKTTRATNLHLIPLPKSLIGFLNFDEQ